MATSKIIEYDKYLSPVRLRRSSQTGRNILTESESDRGRVLYSPAFRRLQQKAQVFSMEPNAAVRSRLTHSLEVSQLGRYIADELELRLMEKGRINEKQQGALVNFVETACLIHDIGNPPFGHFGEAAIQHWFRNNGEKALCSSLNFGAKQPKARRLRYSSTKINQTLSDLFEFDGNPQGFRIVTRLQWNTDEFGLNLTKTTLASFLKYLRSPIQSKGDRFLKKPGFFWSEQPLAHDVWKHFDIDVKKPRRFPLNYIMEAADDIAYCISDLEDSFEKGIVFEKYALPEIAEEYKKLASEYKFSNTSEEHSKITSELDRIISSSKESGSEYTYTNFRTSLNRTIVNYVVQQYMKHEAEIALGTLPTLLPESEPPGAILLVLKNYCRKHVYSHESVQRLELAGYAAIAGLLDKFGCLLEMRSEDFQAALRGSDEAINGDKLLIEPKLLSLFPTKYKNVYRDHLNKTPRGFPKNLWEWNGRAHLLVDFVSGMTDDFAMSTYRNLSGMRL